MHTTSTTAGQHGQPTSRREIDEAQRSRAYRIAGEPLARVPFGRESSGGGADGPRCSDCGAARGEYHVPGCEHEQCPACGDRVIACECAYGRSGGGASMA
jgi:hypothetical protein